MTDKERIEEAHGLWELAVARLSAFAEIGARLGLTDSVFTDMLAAASLKERAAFAIWERISREAVDR